MARSTGPVIAAGAVVAANEALFSPLTGGKADWGSVWRVLPATAGLAVGLALLEKAAPQFAVGLAWLTLLGVFLFPVGTVQPPIQNLNKIMKL